MKQFFALLLLTGIMQKSEINCYWSTDQLLKSSLFDTTVQRNLCQAIKEFLHFNDNSIYNAKDQNRDTLFKICALMEYLVCRCHRFSTPGKSPSIKMEPLKRGMYTFARDKNMLMKRLLNKKEIFSLSTIHNVEKKCFENKEKVKPKLNKITTNLWLGLTETTRSLEITIQKTLNWTTKVAIYMTEETVLKAHILYNKFHENGIQCLKFKLEFIRSIFVLT